MLQKIKNRNQGFTIVETLIVLAIAGLIILIVLLAVPALQRTSRNTNIKSDASSLAGGISEYESNNAGALPTTIPGTPASNGAVNISGGAGTIQATAKIQASDTITTGTSAPTTLAQGKLQVDLKYSCPTTNGGAVVSDSRAAAIFYPVESTGTGGVGCVDD